MPRPHTSGMPKRSRMPRDLNQRAKAVVDFATCQREPAPPVPAKDPAAVELGRRGRENDQGPSRHARHALGRQHERQHHSQLLPERHRHSRELCQELNGKQIP